MTKRQLRAFYDHLNIPASYEQSGLDELKKILLLELKSSSDNHLLIDSRTWTRNDLLEFFDSPMVEGFDETTFYEKYPWARNIAEPSKIAFAINFDIYQVDENEMNEFRNREAINYERVYLEELRKDMRDKRDSYIVSILSFLKCFRVEFQVSTLNTLRSMMYTRFNETLASIESSSAKNKFVHIRFMQNVAYYQLLQQLGETDEELLVTNLQVLGQGIEGGDIDEVLGIVKKQKTIHFPPEGVQFLNELQRELTTMKVQNRAAIDSGKSDSGSGSARVIIGVIIGVLILIAKGARIFNSSSHSYTPPAWNQYQAPTPYRAPSYQLEHVGDSVYIYNEGDTIRIQKDSFYLNGLPTVNQSPSY